MTPKTDLATGAMNYQLAICKGLACIIYQNVMLQGNSMGKEKIFSTNGLIGHLNAKG